MRTRLVFLFVLVALIAAACGGGGSSPAEASTPPASPAAQASAPAGDGDVDCAAITTAAQQLLSIQLLAQLRSPETVESIKSKSIGNLDVDAFLAGMHDLHALDAFASPLGDPKPAIETYEAAGEAAKTLFAADPIDQAAIDTYNEKVGTVADFLSHQIAIAGAIDTAGC